MQALKPGRAHEPETDGFELLNHSLVTSVVGYGLNLESENFELSPYRCGITPRYFSRYRAFSCSPLPLLLR